MTSGDPLGSIFSRIRDEVTDPEPGPESTARPAPAPAVVEATVVDAVYTAPEEFVVEAVDLVDLEPVEPEPHWPVFSVAESATLDDVALRRRRDAAVDTACKVLAPRVKRLLQDEQNELLDAVRRQKGKGDPADVVPSEAEQVARWAEVFRPVVDDLYAAGRTLGGGRTRPAPDGLVDQLVGLLVLPLRERVAGSLGAAVREGPYDGLPDLQRAVASAVGARYREWRGQDLETALGDLASWAFARGVFDATPDGTLLRWVPAEVEQCPDADDNALEPTCKGRPFPTGQSCPPAHAGCRCLVVPASA